MCTRGLFAAVATLLIGCATGSVTLAVKALSDGSTEWRAVAPGATLHSGDQFALKIDVSRNAYVYVAQQSAVVPASVIFPAAGAELLLATPNQAADLPVEGQSFRLDNGVGQKLLCVLASARRLDVTAVTKLLNSPDTCGQNGTIRDPPPMLTEKNRGEVVKANMSSDGIAIARFPFLQSEAQ